MLGMALGCQTAASLAILAAAAPPPNSAVRARAAGMSRVGGWSLGRGLPGAAGAAEAPRWCLAPAAPRPAAWGRPAPVVSQLRPPMNTFPSCLAIRAGYCAHTQAVARRPPPSVAREA